MTFPRQMLNRTSHSLRLRYLALLLPAALMAGCGGGSSESTSSNSGSNTTPDKTQTSWPLTVNGKQQTLTANSTFTLGNIQACAVANKGGNWQLSFELNCGNSQSQASFSVNTTELADGARTEVYRDLSVCALAPDDYRLTLQAQDQNSQVTYSFTRFPADFDFSSGSLYHIASLTDDGTGKGTLTLAPGACP